jgi:hypothetical protein
MGAITIAGAYIKDRFKKVPVRARSNGRRR